MTVSTVNYNTNQYEYNTTGRTQRNIPEFEKTGSATKETVSSGQGETIGLCAVGNQVYLASYADTSTPENPIIKVGDYEVYVNEVNPNNATELEMFALLSYMDDVGLTEQSGMASFSKMRAYASQSEYNGNCEGIYDEEAFWDKKQNWSQILSDAKNTFMQIPNTYEQGVKCEKLLSCLENWINAGQNTDARQILNDKITEMQENIQNGNVDHTPVFQTGGNAYTEEEWDKLLKYVDEVEKEVQEAIDAEKEQALEETKEVVDNTTSDTNKSSSTEEVEEPTLIEKSESTLITSEYTECTYSSQDPEKKDKKFVTWYTEDGMYCEDVNGSVGNNWMIFWENDEQYNKVMEFINQFPDDFNMLFGCNQTFWQDFLNDEIDMDAFMEFMSTTDNGIPDYLIEKGDSVYVDKEKVEKWAKYTNQPGLFRPLERVDEFGNPFPDKEYVDERSGFKWLVNVHGEPYMIGNSAEDFYRHCEKTGADPTKKFAELTGLLQYLSDGSYAYIGSNGISIKSEDGQKLFLDKEDMTYDMLMYMFDNLPETDDYFNPEYWKENMEAAKEAVPKEDFFKYGPEEGKYERAYIDPRDIVYQ